MSPTRASTAYYVFRDSGAPMSPPAPSIPWRSCPRRRAWCRPAKAVPAGDSIELGYHWYLHGGTEESTRIQGAA
ncbi:MAG: hypothetical protein U0166_18610 [Acidobacteriota bacterium]